MGVLLGLTGTTRLSSAFMIQSGLMFHVGVNLISKWILAYGPMVMWACLYQVRANGGPIQTRL